MRTFQRFSLFAILLCASLHTEAQVRYYPLGGSGGFDGPHGCESLIDGVSETKWCSKNTHRDCQDGWWVIFKSSEQIKPTGYILETGDDASVYGNRNWKFWRIYAANFQHEEDATRDAEGWMLVDEKVSGESNSLPASDHATISFALSTKLKMTYSYFKIEVSAPNEGDIIQMSEFAFLTNSKTDSSPLSIVTAVVESPLTYEQKDGQLMALFNIVLSCPLAKKDILTVDGEKMAYIPTKSPCVLQAWLPMVGGQHILAVQRSGKSVCSLSVASPIDEDWGRFQKGTIHLLQATHQDIAWMNTPEYCRTERINDIILPALDMMKEDPNFTFEMEQTLNLMEFLEVHPERKDELIQRYKEGRFLWGATYNQPYEGLSYGELLVRQTYFGRKWIRENLPGCDDFTASNMDVPGRAMQMPQILAKSGIRNLFISRQDEGLYDWASPDGTKILTYSLGHYGWEKFVWHFFDSGVLQAFSRVHDRVLMWNDYYAEHNLPPHYAVLMSSDASKPDSYTELIEQWNDIAAKSEVPLPSLRYSTTDAYLSAIDTPDSNREQINGERPNLWLYIHGPAHYEQTLDKRKAAVLLPAAEFFASINYLSGKEYPRTILDRGWMAALYPDHGLGGNKGETTDSIFADSLELGRKIGESVLHDAIQNIASQVEGNKGDVILFNDLTWERTSMAELTLPPGQYVVKDATGASVPVQVTNKADSSIVRFLATVPSMGYARYSISTTKKPVSLVPSDDVKYGNNYYSNKYYDIVFGNGGIVRLYDKELKRNILEKEELVFGDVLEAEYNGNGAGEFTRITDLILNMGNIQTLSRYQTNWKITDVGPLSITFQNSRNTPNANIIQRITVYHTMKKIDFDVCIENFNGAHNRQYRILFPLNMRLSQSDVCYEVPMAVSHVGKDELKRIPGGWSSQGSYVHHPADSHPREILDFISANGNGFGVTMSSCVAVGDWIDPTIEVTDYPVLQGILLSSHKSCHGLGNWFHQTGTHDFHFSIFTHEADWKAGYAKAVEENHPLQVSFKKEKGGILPSLKSYVTVSDPLVRVTALKKADNKDGIILRLVEMEGKDKDVTITLPFEAKSIVKCNVIEDEGEQLPCSGNIINLPIGHHAIETLLINF